MTRKFLIAAPLALAVGALLSTPAAAASWNNPAQLRSDISQLDRQIDRAQRSGDINRGEASRLRGQVDNLQTLYGRYARGGFNRGEITSLHNRIDAVQDNLAGASRGRDRDRHDARDQHDNRSDSRSDYRGDNRSRR